MVTDPLITEDEALGQLKVSGVDDPDDIATKMSEATAIVITYIKNPTHGWDSDTVPDDIKAAILMQLVELYRFRGDDEDTRDQAEDEKGYLSPRIARLLHRHRDPALA